jgi:hypothetical protein
MSTAAPRYPLRRLHRALRRSPSAFTAKAVQSQGLLATRTVPAPPPQSEFANRLTTSPAVTPCGARLTPFVNSTTPGPTPPRASSASALRGSISSLRIRSPHRMPAPVTCTPAVCQAGSLPCSCLRKLRHQQCILIRERSVNSTRPDQDRRPPDTLPPAPHPLPNTPALSQKMLIPTGHFLRQCPLRCRYATSCPRATPCAVWFHATLPPAGRACDSCSCLTGITR